MAVDPTQPREEQLVVASQRRILAMLRAELQELNMAGVADHDHAQRTARAISRLSAVLSGAQEARPPPPSLRLVE